MKVAILVLVDNPFGDVKDTPFYMGDDGVAILVLVDNPFGAFSEPYLTVWKFLSQSLF